MWRLWVRPETGEAELKQVVAVFNRYDTLGKTITQATEHAWRAREALTPLPLSEIKSLLGDIADFTVARAY